MTGDNDSTKIVELIRRCLALSSSSNEHEAAAAAAKAHELLKKYNLDVSQIDMANDGKPKSTDVKQEWFHVKQSKPGTSSHWKVQLAVVIGDTNYCRVLTGARDETFIFFIGQPHNIAAAREMFAWLVDVLDRIAEAETTKVRKDPAQPWMRLARHFRRFQKSFLFGAVSGVRDALYEARRREAAEMRAVVVRNEEAIQAWIDLNVMFGKDRKPAYDPSSRGVDYNAYLEGQKAGRNVPLNRSAPVSSPKLNQGGN